MKRVKMMKNNRTSKGMKMLCVLAFSFPFFILDKEVYVKWQKKILGM